MHTSSPLMKTKQPEIRTDPAKFSASPANISSMVPPRKSNPYEKHIVIFSLACYAFYWFYYREENELDDFLNVSLFERVPALEEPHLRQAIPRMKRAGVDTTEAEIRLKWLIKERLEREADAKNQ